MLLAQYEELVENEAMKFAIRLIDDPGQFREHIRMFVSLNSDISADHLYRTSEAIILLILYGYTVNTTPYQDPYIR
jgi:hypothetical protein